MTSCATLVDLVIRICIRVPQEQTEQYYCIYNLDHHNHPCLTLRIPLSPPPQAHPLISVVNPRSAHLTPSNSIRTTDSNNLSHHGRCPLRFTTCRIQKLQDRRGLILSLNKVRYWFVSTCHLHLIYEGMACRRHRTWIWYDSA